MNEGLLILYADYLIYSTEQTIATKVSHLMNTWWWCKSWSRDSLVIESNIHK